MNEELQMLESAFERCKLEHEQLNAELSRLIAEPVPTTAEERERRDRRFVEIDKSLAEAGQGLRATLVLRIAPVFDAGGRHHLPSLLLIPNFYQSISV